MWLLTQSQMQISRIIRGAAVILAVICMGLAGAQIFRTSSKAKADKCFLTLRAIYGAKQQWALENRKKPSDVPSWTDLRGYLCNSFPEMQQEGEEKPRCPAGGTYTIAPVADVPLCSISNHNQWNLNKRPKTP